MEKELNEADNGRNSALELFRIFAMLLVVASHIACHAMGNGWKMWDLPFSANQAWSIALGRWGQFGVELFIILSSYFMCDRQGIHSKKIFQLAFQTITTCIIFFFFIRLTGLNMVGKKALLEEAVELFRSNNYWFIPAYIFFYLLLPFLQKISTAKGSSFKVVVIWTAMSIIFYFYKGPSFFGSIGNFVYLYFITAWLKEAERSKPDGHFISRHAGFLSILCYGLLVFEHCFNRYRTSSGQNQIELYFVTTYITIFLEFSLFYLFKKLPIKRSSFINAVAGTVFGVYLLHENFLWLSWKDHELFSILWDQLLKTGVWYESPYFPLFYILATLLVFAACSAVEFILKMLRKQLLIRQKWLDRLCGKIDAWYALGGA